MLNTADTTPSLLLDAKTSAALCSCSVSFWWQQQSAGLLPAPVRLGSKTLWRRVDLERWVELGCPGRHAFEYMRNEQLERSPA